ncbi:MAG: hypothetical protein RLZZ453_771 [Chlamydiota bacterium]|jgi:hypothetical protein
MNPPKVGKPQQHDIQRLTPTKDQGVEKVREVVAQNLWGPVEGEPAELVDVRTSLPTQKPEKVAKEVKDLFRLLFTIFQLKAPLSIEEKKAATIILGKIRDRALACGWEKIADKSQKILGEVGSIDFLRKHLPSLCKEIVPLLVRDLSAVLEIVKIEDPKNRDFDCSVNRLILTAQACHVKEAQDSFNDLIEAMLRLPSELEATIQMVGNLAQDPQVGLWRASWGFICNRLDVLLDPKNVSHRAIIGAFNVAKTPVLGGGRLEKGALENLKLALEKDKKSLQSKREKTTIEKIETLARNAFRF